MRKKTSERRLWRRLLPYILLAGCLGAAGLALYTLYLDGEVRAQFEGARWTLPAKVYADPVEIYVGQRLDADRLIRALQRQGYARHDDIGRPGRFRRTPAGIELHTRAFTFWDGEQPAQRARVRFAGGQVAGLQGLGPDGEDPVLLRLDPLLLGSIHPAKAEDRILIRLGEAPPLLVAGLIMVEDRRFLEHHGISFKSIARAALANLRAGGVVQGGSTISQQLVKNFYLSNRQTLARKTKEALMAVLLDAHYHKEAILEAYLNEVYLGQDGSRAIHGFGLASYFYFQKPLQELGTHEIALLIALVKGPSYYDPRRHPERAERRRNLVLEIFAQAGFIDGAELATARNRPLGVTARAPRGTTQYPAFIDLVRRQLQGQYRDQDLTEEGLNVFTTLDPAAQAAVESRVSGGLEDLERSRGVEVGSLQTAAVVTSVEGGRVLALVGGRDARFAGFNRALDARRPIGSLIKPAVYLTALDRPRRYNVLTPLDDRELEVRLPNGDVWRPRNYDMESHGEAVPLHAALTHSYNQATARLALDLGLPSVVSTLKSLGYPGDPVPVPSLALGAVDMAPLEVAQIYNTLAAGGYYTELKAIRAVTTRDGEPLNRYPLRLKRVFDEQSVYLLNWILQRVVRHGTARSAYHTLPDALNVAGKTGTTDDLRDSWFAGFAEDRVAVVWVGRDDNQPGRLTGAGGALQLWARTMRNLEPSSFRPLQPAGIETVPLILRPPDEEESAEGGFGSGLFSRERDCDRAVPVPFAGGNVPEGLEPCRVADTPAEEGEGNVGDDARSQDGNWLKDLFR